MVSWVEMHIQVVMLFRVTADPAVFRYQFGHLSTFLRIARTLLPLRGSPSDPIALELKSHWSRAHNQVTLIGMVSTTTQPNG
jgi:hypothetical protein